MKLGLIVQIFLFATFRVFSQTPVQESSLNYGASYLGDIVTNTNGGIEQGSMYLGLLKLNVSFDTEKVQWWKGGLVNITAANTHGGEPTSDLIGDFQTVSNIEAGPLTYFQELWYKQIIRNTSVCIGIQDLNADFVVSENSSNLINSSFGIPSVFADNIKSPIFPNTAFGITFSWQISNNMLVQSAIFDGNNNNFENDPLNLSPDFDEKSGFQSFTELQYKFKFSNGNITSLKTGMFYHNHSNIGTATDSSHVANYGMYLVIDQEIIKESADGQGLNAFAQLSMSPCKINLNSKYIGFGLCYTGLIHNRDNDVLSLGMAHAQMNHFVVSSETVIELSYKTELPKSFFLQPDFQYVINPSGTDVALESALVFLCRFGMNF